MNGKNLIGPFSIIFADLLGENLDALENIEIFDDAFLRANAEDASAKTNLGAELCSIYFLTNFIVASINLIVIVGPIN
jgi:hypothetical protein